MKAVRGGLMLVGSAVGSVGGRRIAAWPTRCLAALALGVALLLAPLPAAAQADEPPPAGAYDYAADTDPSAIDDFEARLAPYGTWLYDDTYGYLWVPDRVAVGRKFAPYRSAGRWAVTDAGDWVWVSDYEWGYIPFHYGRWVWIGGRGWAWVPGRVYAPAWVEWRVGEPGYAYVGWAPAPPTFIWVDGLAVGFFGFVTWPWWYCPSAYFFSPYWHNYVVADYHYASVVHSHTHGYGSHYGHQGHRGHGHHKASATAAHEGAGSPRSGSSASGPHKYTLRGIPSSPSFDAARIPKGAQPKARVKPDQRALALRQPSGRKAKRGAIGKARRGAVRRGHGRSMRSAPGARSARSPRRGAWSRSGRGSAAAVRRPRIRHAERGERPGARRGWRRPPAWRQRWGAGSRQPSWRPPSSSRHRRPSAPASRGWSSRGAGRAVSPRYGSRPSMGGNARRTPSTYGRPISRGRPSAHSKSKRRGSSRKRSRGKSGKSRSRGRRSIPSHGHRGGHRR